MTPAEQFIARLQAGADDLSPARRKCVIAGTVPCEINFSELEAKRDKELEGLVRKPLSPRTR